MCCGGDNVKITITTFFELSSLQMNLLFDCTGRRARYLRSKRSKKRIVGTDKAVNLVIMGLIRKSRGK